MATASLKTNPEKCKVGSRELKFLGYVVGKDQTRPLLKKVTTLEEFPAPTNKKHMKLFLGLPALTMPFVSTMGNKKTWWQVQHGMRES